MIICIDPTARETLHDQRDRLGGRFLDYVWSARAFEQEAKNRESLAQWRAWWAQTGNVWDRFCGPDRVRVVEPKSASVVRLRVT